MELIGSFVIAILQSILFFEKKIGISMILFTLASTATLWMILYKKNKIANKKAIIFMLPILLLLSSTYFIFANTTFYILNIIVILLLSILMLIVATNPKNFLKNYLYQAWKLVIQTIQGLGKSINITTQFARNGVKKNSKINHDNVKKWISSFFIVAGVVGVVIMLLASADSIFASIFSNFKNPFENIHLTSLILRLIVIIGVYLIVLGFMTALQKQEHTEDKQLQQSKDKDNFTIKMLLVALNVVYLVFCYIQISTLFARINLPGTFHYAQYARSGFFQLMFVSFINFGLILISIKNNMNCEKFVKMLNLFLIIFTVIIALSSMYRMCMYEAEYGLTYLRAFVLIILGTELMMLIPTTISILLDFNFDLLKWGGIIGVCVYVITNFINLENIIITRNMSRETSKVSRDYNYICKIASCDSYEVLEKILQQEKVETKDKLMVAKKMIKLAKENENMKWQEFNLSRYRFKTKKVDIQKLENVVSKLEEELRKEREKQIVTYNSKSQNYIYEDMIDEEIGYRVNQVDHATGTAWWELEKTINGGETYQLMNSMTVSAPSKIQFFEDGLGFLEEPSSIYCEAATLSVSYDSGKTFTKIDFPEGKFSLSNPEGEEWFDCYDYYYLPIRETDGTLTVLASGGYEGGYNEGKTRAKYASKDNGKTWEFVSEIWK